ncbi:MAG: flagellar hook-basal body complex protein [Pseudobutyrivibrio sp.]|nr:flagellar hook-basal body complex protein [Pseudobutyrivibrio sp.]
MMRSLFSGVAGLKTHQTKMDVIGNNISNVNTVAFKSSSTTFADIMYQTTSQASGATETRGGTNAKQIGLGVTNGATKISITSSGAAQSTGDALDIRLTDSNSTNFFIVSNGTENLFTRAGSFYIDGNGNLAMTTTGYLVQGWQYDEIEGTRTIKKDTVSSLRVMQAANMQSPPESTTQGTFSGVLDQNETALTSTDGYIRSFTFYDNLGYSYTAKFSLKTLNAMTGHYSIELDDVLDANNHSILDDYYNTYNTANFDAVDTDNNGVLSDAEKAAAKDAAMKTIFSTDNPAVKYTIDESNYTVSEVTTAITLADDVTSVAEITSNTGETDENNNVTYATYYIGSDGNVYEAYGTQLNEYRTVSAPTISDVVKGLPSNATITSIATYDEDNKYFDITLDYVGSELVFDTKLGTIYSAGGDLVIGTGDGGDIVFNASLLGPNVSPVDPQDNTTDADINRALSDITINFSTMLNYDNGGTSTVVGKRGASDGTTGAGRKLGTMTGVSIQSNGMIYGSYSNGSTLLLGQIAVAQFSNASGLEEMGNNCYQTTLNSGEFDGIGVDISADGSSMATGQLEMSNVDLSAEFTDMITTQRGFQANSRIITVSDTLLEELINLKR